MLYFAVSLFYSFRYVEMLEEKSEELNDLLIFSIFLEVLILLMIL